MEELLIYKEANANMGRELSELRERNRILERNFNRLLKLFKNKIRGFSLNDLIERLS